MLPRVCFVASSVDMDANMTQMDFTTSPGCPSHVPFHCLFIPDDVPRISYCCCRRWSQAFLFPSLWTTVLKEVQRPRWSWTTMECIPRELLCSPLTPSFWAGCQADKRTPAVQNDETLLTTSCKQSVVPVDNEVEGKVSELLDLLSPCPSSGCRHRCRIDSLYTFELLFPRCLWCLCRMAFRTWTLQNGSSQHLTN